MRQFLRASTRRKVRSRAWRAPAWFVRVHTAQGHLSPPRARMPAHRHLPPAAARQQRDCGHGPSRRRGWATVAVTPDAYLPTPTCPARIPGTRPLRRRVSSSHPIQSAGQATQLSFRHLKGLGDRNSVRVQTAPPLTLRRKMQTWSELHGGLLHDPSHRPLCIRDGLRVGRSVLRTG